MYVYVIFFFQNGSPWESSFSEKYASIWLHKLHSHRTKKKDHKNNDCTTIRTKTIFPHASARGRGKTKKNHRKQQKKTKTTKKTIFPDSLEGGGPSQDSLNIVFFVFFGIFVFFDVFLVFATPPCRGWGKTVFVPSVRCGSAGFN